MYPEPMIIPMREDLTRIGVQELKTAAEVDRELGAQQGTAMVIVNSICGCAAGRMRPAVRTALQHRSKPDRVFSVFAGQDVEATERARSYFTGYRPSSPSLALFREGMYDSARGIEGATELFVRKNRNGGTGYVDLYFYAQWMRFEDMLDPDR